MHDGPDDLSLMAYLSGDCTPEERVLVDAWVARDPAHGALLERLHAAWNPGRPPAFDPDDHLRRRLLRLTAGPRLEVKTRQPFRTAGIGAVLLTAAAGIVLVLGLPEHPPAPTAPAPSREIVTPRGQRAVFALGDGTRVTLDADSRLRVLAEREVQLLGRAYFNVIHDSTRTFRVRTATGVVEDLGTEFVVSAFPEQPATRVVVAAGAVAVHAVTAKPGEAPLATLRRGGMAWIDSTGLARVAEVVDLSPYLAWTEGRHVFRRTPVVDVLAELGRWYDVEITVADPRLLRRRFTASFDNEPLPEVLKVLAVSLGARVERRGRAISLVPSSPSVER